MERILASADDAIARATAALDGGAIVIVPGDTRYLAVVDALDDEAVERLFDALHRPADRPPLALVSGYADLHHVAYGGARARELADAHWPGPTVLQLRARPWLPDLVTGGGESVRAMAPRDAFTNGLVRHFGPLAGAGARRLGEEDSLDATTAAARVGSLAALVVDGGPRAGGAEPTLATQEG